MSFKTIGQVANYKPLYQCGMEELAARQRRIEPSGGILFVRTAERLDKDAARQMILDLFHPDRWPGRLQMLTMPSVNWRFERLLLATREEGWMREPRPRRTFFTAIENDRSIYFAAAAQMPGVETPYRLLKYLRNDKIKFAELGVKTRYASFFFANVDDLMKNDNWDPWDAAWLDYTGPLSIEQLQVIQKFFKSHVRDTLIVTALKARWNRQTSNEIAKAGSHSMWLRQTLFGEILHDIEYFDTVPMAQFAVRHPIDNFGQRKRDIPVADAEIAAVSHSMPDAHESSASGGTNQNNLGQASSDAHTCNAEIAAVGHKRNDAQTTFADGGTNSKNLGHPYSDIHIPGAEITAVGHAMRAAHHQTADGGINSKNDLGHRAPDAHEVRAEVAVAGQIHADAQCLSVDGGTNQNNLGHALVDVQSLAAEIAAVGQPLSDDQLPVANGGTSSSNDLGQTAPDAQKRCAEIAVVGQRHRDTHSDVTDGGSSSNDLGQVGADDHCPSAEIAAVVGHRSHDAQADIADGGTHQRKEQTCQKPRKLALKRKRQPPRKRGSRSAKDLRRKGVKPSRQVSRRRSLQHKRRGKPSAPKKLAKKTSAKQTKPN